MEVTDWIEEIDWGSCAKYTPDFSIANLQQHVIEQIGPESWEKLLDEMEHDSIIFPEPDGKRYLAKESRRSRKFGVERLLNNLNQSRQKYNVGPNITAPEIVGPVMELISNCRPDSLNDWKVYYFENAKDVTLNSLTQKRLIELGLLLFKKLHDLAGLDIKTNRSNLELCVAYITDLVILKSYDGWKLGEERWRTLLDEEYPFTIRSANRLEDEKLHADLVMMISSEFAIGIQVKAHTWRGRISSSRFTQQWGGKVITVSYKKDKLVQTGLVVVNSEVLRLLESLNVEKLRNIAENIALSTSGDKALLICRIACELPKISITQLKSLAQKAKVPKYTTFKKIQQIKEAVRDDLEQ